MQQNQPQVRSTLQHVFNDLAQRRTVRFRNACSPEVTWWLPLGSAAQYEGLPAVEAALLTNLLRDDARVALDSLIIAEDGLSAVTEWSITLPGAVTTPATSVLLLRSDGTITAGRTYVDVAAWNGLDEGASNVRW